MSIDFGLHRRSAATTRPGINAELRKRVFWSCYCLDRQVAILLGRPFALSDRDIDCPVIHCLSLLLKPTAIDFLQLPLDVDEHIEDKGLLAEAERSSQLSRPGNYTTMSAFIHIIKLRQIESAIQQTVYRVDKPTELPDTKIDYFISRLNEWRSTIPAHNQPLADSDVPAFNRQDYFVSGTAYYYGQYSQLCRCCSITRASVFSYILNCRYQKSIFDLWSNVPKSVVVYVRLTNAYINAPLGPLHTQLCSLFSLQVLSSSLFTH